MSGEALETKRLFVSGMMRSGTTLVQKALNAHPDIKLDYQTSTERLIDLKKRFLKTLGRDDYHALCHYNPSPGYSFQAFHNWQRAIDSSIGLFPEMDGDECRVTGVKEVLGEEFFPGLLDQGVYCLNVIRDPRDVITSMSFGRGDPFTGKPRPVLFDLRNWRKSVHFSVRLQASQRFKTIRFEELLSDPDRVLGELFDWLDVDRQPDPSIADRMREGQWAGNSSFGNKTPFDRSAIGGYQSLLPQSVTSFVEATCYPEMTWLGYSTSVTDASRRKAISGYQDPFAVDRPEFEANYSSTPANQDYELNRLEKNIVELNEEIFE